MKRYYKKTLIYAEEVFTKNIAGKKYIMGKTTTGHFETIEDITHKKKELIEAYGNF